MTKCPRCKGAKKSLGIGMMYIDCETCNGLGHVVKLDGIVDPTPNFKPSAVTSEATPSIDATPPALDKLSRVISGKSKDKHG